MFLTGVQSLVRALEARDPHTRGHAGRVAALSVRIARNLHLDDDTVRQIELGANLHDVGKLGVRESVLAKPGPLTRDEYDHVMQHTELGHRILEPLLPSVPVALDIVRFHHERFDGHGRPNGLAGDAIPLAARIVAVADAFDVMTTGRHYRDDGRPLTAAEATEELRRNERAQFDAAVVQAFLAVARAHESMSVRAYESNSYAHTLMHSYSR